MWPHRLQHARLPCPSPSPRICLNSYPLSWDAIQPSHPLLPPSPPALNLSQHQGLFQWVSSLHQVAKVLERQLQHESFQWIFRLYFPKDWLIWSPCWLLLSRVFSSTTIQSNQFFSCWSLWSNFHICTWLLEKKTHSLDYMDLCQQSDVSAF